jgi:DNA repair protein RadC
MAHNHPSGDTVPSAEDSVLTMQILVALVSIDVHFHDHIIIGNSFYSMADDGLLGSMKNQLKFFLKGEYHESK